MSAGLPFVRRSGRQHASVTLVGVCTSHPTLPFADETTRQQLDLSKEEFATMAIDRIFGTKE
jgi:hypothetical protein